MINRKIHSERILLTTLLFLLGILFYSCASTGIKEETYSPTQVLPSEVLCPDKVIWEEIASGIEKTEYLLEDYKVQWTCVRINLDTPGLKIAATPQSVSDKKRYYADKIKLDTLTELSETAVTTSVAINTTPFGKKNSIYPTAGIVKIAGNEICPIAEKYCALAIDNYEDGFRAAVIKNQNEEELSEYPYAFGGFFWILDGDEMPEFANIKHSRTACGIGADGKILYIFACSGMNSLTDRNGLNYNECALILKKLGCTQAMEFDGGHSTTLAVNGKSLIKPSRQRKVPALLILYMVK